MTYQDHLNHLINLARSPGWKAYAWNRAKELDQDRSKLWTGIAEDLKKSMAKN